MATDKQVLVEHNAYIKSDSAAQARLRLGQALWREHEGLPIGTHDRPDGPIKLGSRVHDDPADPEGLNFLTPTIVAQVKDTLAADSSDDQAQDGRLIAETRLWTDLLSSQPLAFNLFGELAADLDLATALCRALWGEHITTVTAVSFEWSPGRSDETYLGTKSAFDVFVAYESDAGKGFAGIEVKYHENMRARATRKGEDWYEDNPRYANVAAASGAFTTEAYDRVAEPATRSAKNSLGGTPLQQIWFDHLLALSMLEADADWVEGRFVFLHTVANPKTVAAAEQYAATLADATTFCDLTLESLVDALQAVTDVEWVGAFAHRYLDFTDVDRLLGPAT